MTRGDEATDNAIADTLFRARRLCGEAYQDPGIYLGFLGIHLLHTLASAPDPRAQLTNFLKFCETEMETEAFKQCWRNAQAAGGAKG